MLPLQYSVDENGLLIVIPTGTEGAHLAVDISPQILDKITEKWYAIAKNEIVTIPHRKSRNRRFSGTISRS
jgi:hypothetical protein